MGGGAAVVQNTRQAANNMGLNGADSWQWTQQQADEFQRQTGMNPELLSLTGPREKSLLGDIVKLVVTVGAPMAGAMIPGLAPFLGAALGGASGTLMTGGNLGQAALSGLTAGAGNALGAGVTGALGGEGFSAGLNTALRANPGSIFTSGAGGAAGGVGGAAGGALGGGVGTAARTAGDVITGALGAGVNEIAPLTVTAASGGGLGGAISGGLGGAAGSVISGGGGRPGGQTPTGGETEVAPLDVTAQPGADITPPFVGLPFTAPDGGGAMTPPGFESTLSNDIFNPPQQPQQPGPLDPATIIGDTVGGVGADLGVGLLAQTLGLLPKPDLSGVPDAGWDEGAAVGPKGGDPFLQTEGPGFGQPPNPAAVSVPAASGSAAPGVIATPGGGGAGGAGGGGAAAAAAGVNESGSAPPSSVAASSDIDLEGGLSPDIYPWRKAVF